MFGVQYYINTILIFIYLIMIWKLSDVFDDKYILHNIIILNLVIFFFFHYIIFLISFYHFSDYEENN
jgi:hypothetical protein